MFGQNPIVGKKFFEGKDKLLVTSLFFTLQGEGPYTGRPAVFLRLAHCNLACSFCDTFFNDGEWYDISELQSKIWNLIPKKYHPTLDWPKFDCGIVFTGGEPSLQNNLQDHIRMFGDDTFDWMQVETNGILYQDWAPQVTVVVSPKCREKNGKSIEYLKPNPKVLDQADCLKFVLSGDPDSSYYTIPDWALEWREDENHRSIYISPMNEYNEEPREARERQVKGKMSLEERSIVNEVVSFWTPGLLNLEKNQRNHEYAGRYCIENNLTLSLQQHLYVGLA